jgi:hypothetical protein
MQIAGKHKQFPLRWDRTDAARPQSATHCRRRSHGLAKASGYDRRALVEADISRYKRVIGDALRSHTDGRRATQGYPRLPSLSAS